MVQFSADDVRRTLKLLFDPGDVVEIRVPEGGKYKVISGYFDEWEELVKDAAKLSGRYPGVYVTLNQIDPALLGRSHNRVKPYAKKTTSASDILRRRFLFIDIDPKRPSGISSTDEERALARALAKRIRDYLRAQGWPDPLIADSGNGIHLIYRIDLAPDDGGLVKRTLKALAILFSDECVIVDASTDGAAHLAKLYGTMACKGDSTPTRPHRLARILEAPEALQAVPQALLEALAGEAAPDNPPSRPAPSGAIAGAFDGAEWMRQYAPDARGPEPWEGGKRWVFNKCPWCGDEGSKAFVIQFPSGAMDARCQRESCPGSRTTGNHWAELCEMREPGYQTRSAKRKTSRAPAGDDPSGFSPHHTDVGNGERLAEHIRGRALWCQERGAWYVFNGQRWEPDAHGQMQTWAKEAARAIYHEAADEPDDKRRAQIKQWANTSESKYRLQAMIDLAQSEPDIPVGAADFDADPWAFNCLNGTLDLRTGALRPHDPADRITRLAPVAYDPAARSEVWERFLETATQDADGHPDRAMIAFLQRAAGYSLTGVTDEEKLFFVNGPGGSGKSTFFVALQKAMGDYADTADFEMLLEQRFHRLSGAASPELVKLVGVRLLVCLEAGKGRRLNEALLKSLTGGDTISCRPLYGKPFSYRPAFKLWLGANSRPRADDEDTGLWRRMLSVPFEHVVPTGQRDPAIKAALCNPAQSGAAILAWAAQGCLAWQRERLGIPEAVQKHTTAYQAENDLLAGFLADRCVLGEDKFVSVADLRLAYVQYCTEGSETPVGLREFSERLRAQGCGNERKWIAGVQVRAWVGVGLARRRRKEPPAPKEPPTPQEPPTPDDPPPDDQPAPDENQRCDNVTPVTRFSQKYPSKNSRDEDFTENDVTLCHNVTVGNNGHAKSDALALTNAEQAPPANAPDDLAARLVTWRRRILQEEAAKGNREAITMLADLADAEASPC